MSKKTSNPTQAVTPSVREMIGYAYVKHCTEGTPGGDDDAVMFEELLRHAFPKVCVTAVRLKEVGSKIEIAPPEATDSSLFWLVTGNNKDFFVLPCPTSPQKFNSTKWFETFGNTRPDNLTICSPALLKVEGGEANELRMLENGILTLIASTREAVIESWNKLLNPMAVQSIALATNPNPNPTTTPVSIPTADPALVANPTPHTPTPVTGIRVEDVTHFFWDNTHQRYTFQINTKANEVVFGPAEIHVGSADVNLAMHDDIRDAIEVAGTDNLIFKVSGHDGNSWSTWTDFPFKLADAKKVWTNPSIPAPMPPSPAGTLASPVEVLPPVPSSGGIQAPRTVAATVINIQLPQPAAAPVATQVVAAPTVPAVPAAPAAVPTTAPAVVASTPPTPVATPVVAAPTVLAPPAVTTAAPTAAPSAAPVVKKPRAKKAAATPAAPAGAAPATPTGTTAAGGGTPPPPAPPTTTGVAPATPAPATSTPWVAYALYGALAILVVVLAILVGMWLGFKKATPKASATIPPAVPAAQSTSSTSNNPSGITLGTNELRALLAGLIQTNQPAVVVVTNPPPPIAPADPLVGVARAKIGIQNVEGNVVVNNFLESGSTQSQGSRRNGPNDAWTPDEPAETVRLATPTEGTTLSVVKRFIPAGNGTRFIIPAGWDIDPAIERGGPTAEEIHSVVNVGSADQPSWRKLGVGGQAARVQEVESMWLWSHKDMTAILELRPKPSR